MYIADPVVIIEGSSSPWWPVIASSGIAFAAAAFVALYTSQRNTKRDLKNQQEQACIHLIDAVDEFNAAMSSRIRVHPMTGLILMTTPPADTAPLWALFREASRAHTAIDLTVGDKAIRGAVDKLMSDALEVLRGLAYYESYLDPTRAAPGDRPNLMAARKAVERQINVVAAVARQQLNGIKEPVFDYESWEWKAPVAPPQDVV